jgi:lipid II:glycine glycyltransferase (peptidoglycan interpeptide bridge formation enzyme)
LRGPASPSLSEAALGVTPGQQLGAQAWDHLLLEQPEANLLQSWKWGELQSRFGWRLERLAFHEGRSGVCSLQRSASLFPGGAVYYVPRGPVVVERERLLVLDELERRAAAGRGLVLRVEPNAVVGDEWPAFFEGRGFVRAKAVQPEATRLLRIDVDPESLKAGFKPKTRYNLNLAEKKGVRVRGSRDVATFARLAAETGKRQDIHLPGVAYYQAALDLFGPSDEVRLYFAEHEGETLGGIMVFRFGRTAYYLFGGSSDRKRELMPNYSLHWQAMLDFRAMGCDTYDWWGIPEEPAPDHPWFGLYRFKTGFGGETVRYIGLYEHVLRPGPLKLERRLHQLKAKLRPPILQ